MQPARHTTDVHPAATTTSPSRWYWCIIAVLLVTPVMLGVSCAALWTPTHDEYWHLPLGLYALKTGDGRADPINPPLVRMWAALPLWLSGIELGDVEFPAKDAYAVGDAFQRAHPQNHRDLFFRGRLMMLPFHLVGGVILVWWSRRWWGDAAGMLAAALWCGCPVLIAHATLVAHDFPATVLTLAVLFVAVRDREHPRTFRPWLIGGLIGIACLMKFSALSLLGIVPVFWWLWPGLPSTIRRQLVGLLSMIIAWWLVLHAGYAMDSVWGQPLPSTDRITAWLPRGFVHGIEALRATLKVPHPVFLDGEWSLSGFRTYYLRALAYQLPLGLWTGLFISTGLAARCGRHAVERRRWAALLFVITAILLPASLSANQLGLRYVMPIVPLMILLASSAARDWRTAGRGRRISVMIAAGLSLVALRYHPHHLSYFNEFAEGPSRGYQHLVDSNLDWGQDLHGLKKYLERYPSKEPLFLAYFGTASPALLGIDYQFPPSPQPQPGRYAISANYVAGRPHMLRDIDGRTRMVALDEYAPFRYFTPKARIGYSIHYYEILPEDVARYHRDRERALREFGGR